MSCLHEKKVNEAVAASLLTAISLVAGNNVALDVAAVDEGNPASTLADRANSARQSLFAVEPALKTRAPSVHVAQWTNVQ